MTAVLLLTHSVRDFDEWKKVYDAHAPARAKAGLVEMFVARDVHKPNIVHVGLAAPSVQAASSFLGEADLRDAMANAGVASAPVVHIGTRV
jgi:hypothetical protein